MCLTVSCVKRLQLCSACKQTSCKLSFMAFMPHMPAANIWLSHRCITPTCDTCQPEQAPDRSETLTMSAGGENGFNQAIELSADTLANVKFVQEKRLISKFFDEISQDTNKYVFGVADTLQCLEMGAVETLVVWEDLQVYRYTLMNSTSGEPVLHSACTSECCVSTQTRQP